jgi:hypothetical protein
MDRSRRMLLAGRGLGAAESPFSKEFLLERVERGWIGREMRDLSS